MKSMKAMKKPPMKRMPPMREVPPRKRALEESSSEESSSQPPVLKKPARMEAPLTARKIPPLKTSKTAASSQIVVSDLPWTKPPPKKRPAAAAGTLGPSGTPALALRGAKASLKQASILAAAFTGRPPTVARVEKWAAAGEQRFQKFGHRYNPDSAQGGGTTLLEKVVVLDSGEKDYVLRVQAFEQWRLVNQLPQQTSHEVVLYQFLDYLDEMFVAGGGHDDGSKTWAGLMHLIPQLKSQVSLCVRVKKALTGWAKRAPAGSRAPTAEVVVMALIGDMIGRSKLVEALNCLLQFLTCRRPGEIDALLVNQLIPPSQAAAGRLKEVWGVLLHPQQANLPGKTGEFDESILLNDPEWNFMNPHWLALISGRPASDRLFPLEGLVISQCFQKSVENLNLQSENLVRYGLRHAGASNDLLSGKRTREEVKARAGWKTDSSMSRYTKETHALKALNRVPPKVIEYGTFVKANLPAILSGQVRLLPFLSQPMPTSV